MSLPIISQNLLRAFDDAVRQERKARQHKEKLRLQVLFFTCRRVPIEPGSISLYLKRREVIAFTKAKLLKALGDEGFERLAAIIEPSVRESLILEIRDSNIASFSGDKGAVETVSSDF